MSLVAGLMLLGALYAVFRLLTRLQAHHSEIADLPGPPAQSWIKGNLGQLFNAKGLPFHQSLTDIYGGMVKVYGFFGDEQLYISDAHALHHILLKEQDAFEETAVFTETNKVIFGPGLVATTGEQHARQRRLVTPIFAVPHLRQLVPVFYHVADKLADVMQHGIEGHSVVMDMSEWMSRVALESVGQTVLGYSFDPLDSPHNNPYTAAIKELIPTLFSLALVRQFAPFLAKLGPPWFRRKLVEWTPHSAVQQVKDMSDVMHRTAEDILRQKREEIARLDKGIMGNGEKTNTKDIVSILLRANEQAKAQNTEQLSDLELTGQMTVLIFGAQDTTASCLSRVLYQLALPQHRDFQEKVRQEIQMATMSSEDGARLDYDALGKLPILDAVLKETLRLFPPVPFVRRSVLKETLIPYVPQRSDVGGIQEKDGIVKTVRVPSGTILFVGIMGANRLESVWGKDSTEWKPERWLEARPCTAKLPGVYQNMLSFLGGGRSCVGYKFALLEMKIILAVLISRFAFSTTEDEVVWNLSQIISPSVRETRNNRPQFEHKGMPLVVESL